MEGNLKKIISMKLAALASSAIEEAKQGLVEGKATHFKQLHFRAISGIDEKAEKVFNRKIVPFIKSLETKYLLSFADSEIQRYEPRLKQKQYFCSELYRRAINEMDRLANNFLYANWERIIIGSWGGSEDDVQEVFLRLFEKVKKKAFKYETIEGLGNYLKSILVRVNADRFRPIKRMICNSINDNIEKLTTEKKTILKNNLIKKDILIKGKHVLNDFDNAILSLTLEGKKPKEMLALNPNLKNKFGDDNKKLSDFRRESYWHLYKVLHECLSLEGKEKYHRIFHKLILGIPKFVSAEDVVLMEEEKNPF